ncbi:nucleoside/nucleotide kinase family protein [Protaetiibacter intestinalis]|uniref:Uridine kinase n=1 Tax=Protaetiibacter intestinalis TaxID=2419774 RepID=A0A387B5F8_9MICO|nr:uridine kinase [Protaetiibacter intestinalis]AYF98862.1 uridine kinase [Protaetiibacter intestinalis]
MARWAPLRRDVIAATVDEILGNYRRGRIAIAVDGADGAGKTVFADDLAREFERRGLAVARASIDDFHAPAEQRYRRGRFSAEGCYRDGYQYDVFRRVLIEPFRVGGSAAFVTAAFDYRRDTPIEPKWTTGPADLFLIVDGVFLNRPELRGIWNYSIWLEADAEVRAERMRVRDGSTPSPELAARYDGAQELYERDAKPRQAAIAIIDNTDVEHPRRVFADAC